MEKRISKTFKQFMFDLEPDVRAGVYSQIINHCHVTPTCINMWARGATAPQLWRIKFINSLAKKYGCVIKFETTKRKSQISGI